MRDISHGKKEDTKADTKVEVMQPKAEAEIKKEINETLSKEPIPQPLKEQPPKANTDKKPKSIKKDLNDIKDIINKLLK